MNEQIFSRREDGRRARRANDVISPFMFHAPGEGGDIGTRSLRIHNLSKRIIRAIEDTMHWGDFADVAPFLWRRVVHSVLRRRCCIASHDSRIATQKRA